jgi:polysaccharide pyruvyl transferase CsaB
MGNAAKTIVISGYYGFANSGDEAVLHGIVTSLQEEAKKAAQEVRIVVLSGNPEETRRIHRVEAAHRMRPLEVYRALRRADCLISGGGSLLQDVTSAKSVLYYLAVICLAQRLQKPVYVYAQGVGPIRRRERFGPMIRSAFQACRYVSVRDVESKALLASFGLPSEHIDVVPDPVMGLEAKVPKEGAEGPVLGVSVRYWREDRAELETIAQALKRICEARPDVRLVFLPFHLPQDREVSDVVAGKLAEFGVPPERWRVHPGTEHPADMMAEVASCDVLVGMRLHSLIYAAAAGVPPIGVSYDPKIDQFLRRLDEAPAGSTEALDAENLAETVLQRLEEGKANWYRRKFERIEEMRQQSRKPAQQIFRDMRI